MVKERLHQLGATVRPRLVTERSSRLLYDEVAGTWAPVDLLHVEALSFVSTVCDLQNLSSILSGHFDHSVDQTSRSQGISVEYNRINEASHAEQHGCIIYIGNYT